MTCVEKHIVTLFLFRAKNLIHANSFVIASRKQNSDTLAQLGLLYRHQIEIIRSLTYRDYFNTLPAKGKVPEAWEFGITEQGRTIYIKLAINSGGTRNEHLACISFHFASDAIDYPYKK
jgi:hypothetical protein